MATTENRKKRLGDRNDGWKIRKMDTVFLLIPFIMKNRVGAQVYADERINITSLETFVRQQKEKIPDLSALHVILAALVRTISQKPRVNRFVIHGGIYARNYLRISMMVKRELSEDAAELGIMPEFKPTDTLYDVVKEFNARRDEAFGESDSTNGCDDLARTIGKFPPMIRSWIVNVVRFLDNRGILPKAIRDASPFHSTVYVTSMGSLGINPVYHHLYDFGTTSMFVAIGRKGGTRENRYIDFRLSLDERVCDGYYFASAIKKFKSILKDPEQLLEPPEHVVYDEID